MIVTQKWYSEVKFQIFVLLFGFVFIFQKIKLYVLCLDV